MIAAIALVYAKTHLSSLALLLAFLAMFTEPIPFSDFHGVVQ